MALLPDGRVEEGGRPLSGGGSDIAPSFATRAHTTKHKSKAGPSDNGNERTAAREAYTDIEGVKRDTGGGFRKHALAMLTPCARPSAGRSAHLHMPHAHAFGFLSFFRARAEQGEPSDTGERETR